MSVWLNEVENDYKLNNSYDTDVNSNFCIENHVQNSDATSNQRITCNLCLIRKNCLTKVSL